MPSSSEFTLTVRITAEYGSLWATVDKCPGVFATGDTLVELHESLIEGLRLYGVEKLDGALRDDWI